MLRNRRTADATDEFDYVVVGGGSAGSIVAGRVAQTGARVLLLEAGGTDRRPEVALPVGVPFAYKKLNWHYPVEPDASRGGIVEKWPAGKVLGGGGSINAGVFVRGNPRDYDNWAAQGAKGWDYESVLPAFRRLENWEAGPDHYRGSGGPINVRWHRVEHRSNDRFIAAAEEADYPFNPDYNGATQDGVGVSQVNQRGHFRSQSAREYLRGLAPADRLVVRTGATVERVLIEGEAATGVQYRHGGETRVARATREVILSAGTLGTPKLLLLSGIGPAAELGALGIATKSDLPGVGQNLQEHQCLFLRFEALVPNLNTMGPREELRGLGTYVRSGGGFLASTMGHAQAMHRTDPGLERPDVQICFANFGTVRTIDAAGDVSVAIPREGSYLVTMMATQPTPRGRVSLRSADPKAPPRVAIELLADADMKGIIAGVAESRRVMSQPAMREVGGELLGTHPDSADEGAWTDWVRASCFGGAHPVGTARMGVDADAVVDPELRVHGVSCLRVADASVMPTITNGNTNAPSMMIGERAAELIARTSTMASIAGA